MYYDRTLSEDFLSVLRPDGAVGWLVPWVRSERGAAALADLQFRRSNGRRAQGAVQLYVGGTSVLEIVAYTGSQCELTTHQQYRAADPGLFEQRVHQDFLRGLSARMQRHLESVMAVVGSRHLEQEAKLHSGMMRRYGLGWRASDPVAVLDREVVIGHDNMVARDELDALIREKLAIESANHRELDVIGVLTDGRVALIELKAGALSPELQTATLQAASHILRFQHLDHAAPTWRERLRHLAQQKASIGLLAAASLPLRSFEGAVPIIAAPDSDPVWQGRWREAIREVRVRAGSLLSGLRMWRLDDAGVVIEEAQA